MKFFLVNLVVVVFAAAISYSFFGPFLIGTFLLVAAIYFLFNREPNNILAFAYAAIGLICYLGVFYWGWGQ